MNKFALGCGVVLAILLFIVVIAALALGGNPGRSDECTRQRRPRATRSEQGANRGRAAPAISSGTGAIE